MGKIKIGYRKLSETKRGKTLNIPSIGKKVGLKISSC